VRYIYLHQGRHGKRPPKPPGNRSEVGENPAAPARPDNLSLRRESVRADPWSGAQGTTDDRDWPPYPDEMANETGRETMTKQIKIDVITAAVDRMQASLNFPADWQGEEAAQEYWARTVGQWACWSWARAIYRAEGRRQLIAAMAELAGA
jgi:hypothetical protein